MTDTVLSYVPAYISSEKEILSFQDQIGSNFSNQ